MSDYLTNLLVRTWYPERTIQPRLRSMFDPAAPAGSMSREGGSWGSEEKPYQTCRTNHAVHGYGLSVRQSQQGTVEGPELDKSIGEQDGPRQDLPLESGISAERWDFASTAAAPSEQAAVALDANPALGQGRIKATIDRGIASSHSPVSLSEHATVRSGHESIQEIALRHGEESTTPAASDFMEFEQRSSSSRNALGQEAGAFSPMDHSTVGQDETVLFGQSTAQSMMSSLQLPFDEAKRSGVSRMSPLIEGFTSEQSMVPLAGESWLADQQPASNGVTNSTDIDAHRSQHSLGGMPPGASQKKAKRPLVERQKFGAGEMPDFSEIVLDPSLVSPASALNASRISQPVTSHKPGNPPLMPFAPADTEDVVVPSLPIPIPRKKFLAVHHSIAPMTAATVGQVMATEGGKPAEPVVQVTIGRVEVRAVAPPVRQERSRKPQSAMSLDDYLTRRGGRSGG